MPGLIRGVARTAVVAGTATAVSNNVSRRQSQKWASQAQQQPQYQQPQYQPAPPAPAPAAEAAPDPMAKLQQLAELHAQGILSDEEFASAKAKVLADL